MLRHSLSHPVAIRRPVLIAGVLAGAMFACWAMALTGYLLFQDELAAVLLRRQASMQYAYEARIDGLKAQIDRAASQALVERQAVEGRVAGLLARQARIEERQATIKAFAERTLGPLSGGAPAVAASPQGAEARLLAPPLRTGTAAKPTPLDDPELMPAASGRTAPAAALAPPRTADKLSRIEDALDRVSAEQMGTLDGLQKTARSRLDLLDGAIAGLGLDTARLEGSPRAKAESGIGGPLVSLPAGAGPFDVTTGELDSTIRRFGRLREVARSLPLTRPVSGNLEPSSPFGYRVDPFTRAAALHTGLDLRAEYGTEVRATGPGRVTAAEASGGYGNMVEIDHGNDVVTRYAHLSAIGVSEGQEVAAGAVVGHVGSTGRSTGAHLHYETRIAGEPVNPQRFLQAGALLATAAR